MIAVDWQAVEAFRATSEFRALGALGVLGQHAAALAQFPELDAREKARSARIVERDVYGANPPSTPDPDAT